MPKNEVDCIVNFTNNVIYRTPDVHILAIAVRIT